MRAAERLLIDGPAGAIEVFAEWRERPAGIALILHPHPLFGGTADNKVVTTLARAFRELGYATLRPHFRGVGASAGAHDHGVGETLDMLAVHDWARQRLGALPVAVAGFSFGAYVATRLAEALAARGDPAECIERLVLVGTAAGHIEGARAYPLAAVPPDTVVIHGADDATVPLANLLAWAGSIDLPVTVIPGADHFFHRKLHHIRDIVARAWGR